MHVARLMDLASLPAAEFSAGVRRSVVVDPASCGGTQFVAELFRIQGRGEVTVEAPSGSDRYLFLLSGAARLRGRTLETGLSSRTFVSLGEGERFVLSGSGAGETELLSVTAPPAGSARSTQGSTKGTVSSDTSRLPVVEEPASKKRRIYLATRDTLGTKRAHGMIVIYEGDTVTPVHSHPDAESLFVFLDHPALVLVNDREVLVEGGQAVFWGLGEDHGLRSATPAGLSFLEFHIPGEYGVVRRSEAAGSASGVVA